MKRVILMLEKYITWRKNEVKAKRPFLKI